MSIGYYEELDHIDGRKLDEIFEWDDILDR